MSDIQPRVSVIIVNWNRKEYLSRCLQAVQNQTYPHIETLFIDNGSQDGSVDFVRNHFPDVRVVALDRNMGFAPANNIGIALATGEYIMTLNNDTEMEPACVSEMTRTLAASPASWACAPKIVSFDAPPMIVNAGIGVRDHMPTDRGGGEPDDGRYDTPEEVFGPNGGAGLYKKKVLDEIGLYDEDFFFYYEDVDLAWRARLAGWTCVYAPAAICRHESGGTSKALPFFTEYHIFRNLIWLYLKNIPAPYFRKKLPGLIWQEIIFWKAQITRRESRWIRMKLDAYRKIPRMLMKRRHVQKMRRISNGELERWIVPMLPS